MARKLAIVALVILILWLVLPLGIGMAMGMCPDCSTAGTSGTAAMCAILVAALFVAGLAFSRRLAYLGAGRPPLGVVPTFERPPRPL